MSKGDYSGSHRPSAMMICNRRMLLVQRRFNVSSILYHTFIVAKDMSEIAFRRGDSKASQFESQMFDRFQAGLQGNEFRRKCTCLDRLLPFAVPDDRGSVEKNHVSSVGSASLLICGMRCVYIRCRYHTSSTWHWHAMWQRLIGMRCGIGSSALRYISEKSSFLVRNSP
jgi:hypothetical protein